MGKLLAQLTKLLKAQVMTGIRPQNQTIWKGLVVEAEHEQMEIIDE